MQTDSEPTKKHVSYYGKKIYFINPLIAQKLAIAEKVPECLYEDIDEKYKD